MTMESSSNIDDVLQCRQFALRTDPVGIPGINIGVDPHVWVDSCLTPSLEFFAHLGHARLLMPFVLACLWQNANLVNCEELKSQAPSHLAQGTATEQPFDFGRKY